MRPSTPCSRWPTATRSSIRRIAPGRAATDSPAPDGPAGRLSGSGMIGVVTDGREVEQLVVGVLGGTGPQGRGLAVRFAAAGQRILLGSRGAERAGEVAEQVAGSAATAAGGAEVSVQGGANADVAGA